MLNLKYFQLWLLSLTFFSISGLAASPNDQPTVRMLMLKIDQHPYSISFQYPQLSNLPNTNIQDQVNRQIQNQANQWVNSTKQDYQVITSYPKVYACTSKILSVALSIEMTSSLHPMAHPNNGLLIFNYDLTTGKKIILADLFPNQNYLKIIASKAYPKVIDQLKKAQILTGNLNEKEALDWIKRGTAPIPENYKYFAVAEDAVFIIFPYYQIGPRYFGEQVISIALTTHGE